MAILPPAPDDGDSPEREPRLCPRCGRPLEVFRLELPMGLGVRTFTGECACEQERRAVEARERATTEHREQHRGSRAGESPSSGAGGRIAITHPSALAGAGTARRA